MNHNLYQLFSKNFSNALDNVAIESESGKTYSYRALDHRSAQYANLLLRLGLKKGDRIAVQVDKSIDALFLYLGCLRSGIIYLPLNTAYKDSELEYFYQDAKPKLIVCSPDNLARTQNIAQACKIDQVETLADDSGSLVEQSLVQNKEFTTISCGETDVAVIVYTSGTTGKPKGSMLTHLNLATNGLALRDYWGFQRGDALLHMLPIFHVHGLFFACHCALLSGSKMLFIEKFNVDTAIKLIPQSTVMMGVPTYYTRLLADPRFDRSLCKNMRLFTSGSAPLLEKTFNEFFERSGLKLLERYGMTETGVLASNPLEGDRRASTVGFPLPGNHLRVVDDNNCAAAVNAPGDIQVKGNNVFIGYWNKPKTDKDFTKDGYFKTGDQGFVDEQGYLSIIGRSKDMIITGGLNVYPKEVEQCIDKIPGVLESAVIGVPDEDFGEAVIAVVVKRPGAAITEDEIIARAKSELANFKAPKLIVFTDELPRNTMGKVQKNILRNKLNIMARN